MIRCLGWKSSCLCSEFQKHVPYLQYLLRASSSVLHISRISFPSNSQKCHYCILCSAFGWLLLQIIRMSKSDVSDRLPSTSPTLRHISQLFFFLHFIFLSFCIPPPNICIPIVDHIGHRGFLGNKVFISCL